MIEIDDMAPDFCLPDKDGNEVCTTSFRGKWLIVYFYPKDNTQGCTVEAIDFSESQVELEELNAAVIGISPDSIRSHLKFVNKHNLSVILLSDTTRKTLEEYGVLKLKKMYGREYLGVERSTFIINPSGRVTAIFRRVKVKGHIDEVKAKLKELHNQTSQG